MCQIENSLSEIEKIISNERLKKVQVLQLKTSNFHFKQFLI